MKSVSQQEQDTSLEPFPLLDGKVRACTISSAMGLGFRVDPSN